MSWNCVSSTSQTRLWAFAMPCKATAAFLCPPPASWKTICIFFMTRFCHGFVTSQPPFTPCYVENSKSPLCSMSYMDTFTYNSQPLHGLFISKSDNFAMRCDLHVHTKASGLINTPFIRHFCYESYNDAEAVYDRCKRLGMSIVTVTDHDSIDAAEILRSRP